jgi:Secretion system C-terminal sorting domain/Outer membrane protein Omp28
MRKITLLFTLLFFTTHNYAQVLYSENFDTSLNWTVIHSTGTSGLTGWSRVTTGTNPNCSPFAGNGMAQFNSNDIVSGNSYSLTSPAISYSGANYAVRIKMYRDAAAGSDRIRIYTNTVASSTGGTLLGTVIRAIGSFPIVTSEGWYSYSFNLPAGITGDNYISVLGTSLNGNNIYIDEVSVYQVATNDAEMSTVNFNTIVTNLGNTAVSGSIKNTGLNDINSVDLNWQVDGGTTHSQSLTGLTITPGQLYNYTHSDQWDVTPGYHSLRVWLSNTNGSDADSTNNEIIKSIYVVNEVFPKTVVYEEATGTWCQWCPRGQVGLKDMLHNHPDGSFIGIAVHNQDPMVVAAYNSAIANFISGYPSGTLNRIPVEVDPGLSTIEPAYQAALTRVPLGKVSIPDVNWNATTRQISFDVNSQFALDMPNVNYKVAAVIVENGVTGTTSTYNQANAYSGAIDLIDWEGNNWRNLPSTVPASTMVYNHVGRALLGGFNGVTNSVPTTVTYNTPYSTSFTHTLPILQNVNKVEVVALLLDSATGLIANATIFDLGAKIALATTNFDEKGKFSIYPNPTTGILHLETEKAVNVTIIDVLGKIMLTKNNITNQSGLDISSLSKGIYFARITGENSNFIEKIILN